MKKMKLTSQKENRAIPCVPEPGKDSVVYCRSVNEVKMAAHIKQGFITDGILREKPYRCDCGESYAMEVINENGNIIKKYVACEQCFNAYK